MSKFLASTLAIAGLGIALAGAPSYAANPSSDDIIKQLTPAGGAANTDANSLHVRGLRLLNANPGSGGAKAQSESPSVALDVRFMPGSAELTPEAKDVLRHLGQAMTSDQLAHYRFRLEGHTDSSGKPETNLVLSQRRAESVQDFLVSEFKIAPQRLESVGKGQTDPADPAHPESGVNRRVKVVNLGES